MMMLVLYDEQVEALKAGKQVSRTYTSRMLGEIDNRSRIPVQASSNHGFEVDVYVRVVGSKLEQRGRGQKRPQYNHTYTFERVE